MESKRTTPQTNSSSSAVVSKSRNDGGNPAAFQVRGERHNHETQLQNLHGNSIARGHLFLLERLQHSAQISVAS